MREVDVSETKTWNFQINSNWLQTNWLADYQKRRSKCSSGHVDISPEKDGGNRGGQRGHLWASCVWDLQRRLGSDVDCSRQQYVIDWGNRHKTTLHVIFLQKLPYIAHCKQIDRSFVLRHFDCKWKCIVNIVHILCLLWIFVHILCILWIFVHSE